MVIVIILPRNVIFHLQLSWQVKPQTAVSSHSAQHSASNLQAAEVCIYVDLCVDLCVETTRTCGFLHANALCVGGNISEPLEFANTTIFTNAWI